MGLARALEQQKNDIETKLTALVGSDAAPSQAQLEAVSGGPSLKVTRRVIEAIRQEKATEQGVIVKRLASEMATNRVMEYALMTRRALLAGMTEPNIAAHPPAVKHITEKIHELGAEIENMVFEMRVRASLAGNMTQVLLQRSGARHSVPLRLARLADVFAQLRWWLTGFRAAVVALLIWRWPALVYWVYPEALAGFEQKRSALMGWRYKVLIGFVAVELLLVHNALAMLTKGIL
ncbi:MAG: hypothetical protein CSA53_02045 [Gammaproteobacteria bacterium]|nr:MAG: hypothetical protein CSA53_02045 [Gammaproteobacteria bacterium]